MTLMEKITADLTAAMKAQDAPRTGVLRMAKAALKNKEIDKKAPLDDPEALAVLRSLVKQREDSIFQFRKANRPELVEKEEAEVVILLGYLPAQLDEAQLKAMVEAAVVKTGATGPRDMGTVMKALLPDVQGKADGKLVSELVKARLSGT